MSKQKQKYLIFTERSLDGKIVDAHQMRREYIIAKYRREVLTVVEIDAELEQDISEALELE